MATVAKNQTLAINKFVEEQFSLRNVCRAKLNKGTNR